VSFITQPRTTTPLLWHISSAAGQEERGGQLRMPWVIEKVEEGLGVFASVLVRLSEKELEWDRSVLVAE
jgi:hypothetical protein